MWSIDRKRLAGAVILIAVLLIPAILISGAQGYIPVLFFLFLYALSFAMLLIERRSVSFDDTLQKSVCVRGDVFEHVIRVRNETVFLIPSVVLLFYDASGVIGAGLLKETFSLGPKEEKQIPVPVMPSHIGTFRCGVSGMVIRGLLGVVSWESRTDEPNRLTVLPKLHDIDNFAEMTGSGGRSSNETRSSKSSTDPAGVREYISGDTMKDIHWKLSASGRGLMTKLREEASAGDMDVILDLGGAAASVGSARDVLIEAAMSLMNYAVSHGSRARLIYRNESGRVCCDHDVAPDLFSFMDADSSGSKEEVQWQPFILRCAYGSADAAGWGSSVAGRPGASLVMITVRPSDSLLTDLAEAAAVRQVILISLEGDEDVTDRYGIDHFVISGAEDLELKAKRAS